jgi:hypothetical protein
MVNPDECIHCHRKLSPHERPLISAGMTPPQRAQVVGVFLLLHNVSAWQTLRDEGQWSGQEAAKVVEWAARTLLDALGRGPAAKPAEAPLRKPQGPEVDSHR